MEPVGFLSIIKLTTLILRKHIKHFLCIAVLWVILYAFHLQMLDLSSFALSALVHNVLFVRRLMTSEAQSLLQFPAASLPPPNNSTDPSFPNNSTDPSFPALPISSLLPIIASFLCSITISLISYSLLTFSVCRACLNKSVCLKGSLLGILRSAKRLVLTSMCVGAVAFGYTSTSLVMLGIIGGVVLLVRGNEPTTMGLAMFVPTIPMGVGGVYLAVLFSLAHTAAVLEENTRGWGALTRSMSLLNGRKWLALGLACVFYALSEACEMWELWRWRGAQMVRVSLQAVIALYGVAANVVLYMSCKREKEETLDTLVAARAQFGPPETSSQGMDVETTAFLPTIREWNENTTIFGVKQGAY